MLKLNGRTLLLMGGSAYADDIKAYQKKTGFRIVAVGKDRDTAISRSADVFYNVDTKNVDEVIKVVEKEGVDGIFVGASEVNIDPAIDVSEKSQARFYVTRKQWNILSDKDAFKQACRKAGVSVVKEFYCEGPTDEKVKYFPFPLMLKPADSSGARGMYICNTFDDFKEKYIEALKWSKKKKIIVEELITDAREVFFQYNIQDGRAVLSSCFTKVFTISDNRNLVLPILHVYPSKFIDEYYDKIHGAVLRLFKDLDIKNGYMTLQTFYKNGQFYIFEAGYRMGGAQNYIFTEYQNHVNALECMVNYALTGRMSEENLTEKDNAHFKYPCCNYYVGLRPGVIKSIDGLDSVRSMDGVLNVTVMARPGDVIPDTNALERVCLRIHVVGKDAHDLAETLVDISKTLNIVSTKGEEMKLEQLTYNRCISAIRDSAEITGGYSWLVIFCASHDMDAFERGRALCA